MKQKIFKYLVSYSTNALKIDKLIISSFIISNNVKIRSNKLLKKYSITSDDNEEYEKVNEFVAIVTSELGVFDFETLIELFEFVISPEDRIVSGAVYTPFEIRSYIINEVINNLNKQKYNTLKYADISCGCGGFLFDLAKKIKSKTNQSYTKIFENNLFGVDIQSYSITRTKLILSLLAVINNEDIAEIKFNLYEGDSLSFDWSSIIEKFNGFDVIVGNPPYVRLRNLNNETKELLKNWEVCKTGLIDLYIPFFQIGIENLSNNGILGYITVNSFFKSLNGRALREYFKRKELPVKIIDFGSEQIFRAKNTYTCLCFIENTQKPYIEYTSSEKSKLKIKHTFNKIKYDELNSFSGWNLQDRKNINKIESTGIPFKEIYKTRHGIATLKNDIYIFKPIKEDENYFYLQNGKVFKIEKEICRDIINPNKLKNNQQLEELKEKVIFPYNNEIKPRLLDENKIENEFPFAYEYLKHKKEILNNRDKGKGNYINWYAFGRSQSLKKVENKLFFPKISNKPPNCIIEFDENLLFYNGQAIIGNTPEELEIIKKIMESKLFWYYITKTSKPYNSNYYSLNGNYINNFGIYNFSEEEKNFILNESDKLKLDRFFEEIYDIKV